MQHQMVQTYTFRSADSKQEDAKSEELHVCFNGAPGI